MVARDNSMSCGLNARSGNEVLARLMDAGKQLVARIVNKEYHGDRLRLDIEIFLIEIRPREY